MPCARQWQRIRGGGRGAALPRATTKRPPSLAGLRGPGCQADRYYPAFSIFVVFWTLAFAGEQSTDKLKGMC